MLELILFIDDFIDVVLAVQIFPKSGNLLFVFLNANLLIFELFFELLDPLILFNGVWWMVFFLFSLPFFLQNLIHFHGQFFELGFELDVLIDQFCLRSSVSHSSELNIFGNETLFIFTTCYNNFLIYSNFTQIKQNNIIELFYWKIHK